MDKLWQVMIEPKTFSFLNLSHDIDHVSMPEVIETFRREGAGKSYITFVFSIGTEV